MQIVAAMLGRLRHLGNAGATSNAERACRARREAAASVESALLRIAPRSRPAASRSQAS